jgi:dihydroceramide fatty acyl 2-hydroxylase
MTSEPLLSAVQHRPANVPFDIYKAEQAKISRGRLYPFTAFYTAFSAIVFLLVLRSARPGLGLVLFLLTIPLWTLIEYLFHRYVLHGRFPAHDGVIGRFLHDRLDPLHWEHHERPFDGMHISGALKDFLPVFSIIAPLLFWLTPVYTGPVILAGIFQCYVIEEWIHHSVHFYDFKNPYFRYIKRYHRYHHTKPGMEMGFGLTSGIWDVPFRTRYPQPVRQALFSRRAED